MSLLWACDDPGSSSLALAGTGTSAAEYWIPAIFGKQADRPRESCKSVWVLLRLEILQWQHSSQEQAGRISGTIQCHYTIYTWHCIIDTQDTSDALPWIQLFIPISNELILPVFDPLQSWRSEPVMPCLSLQPMKSTENFGMWFTRPALDVFFRIR